MQFLRPKGNKACTLRNIPVPEAIKLCRFSHTRIAEAKSAPGRPKMVARRTKTAQRGPKSAPRGLPREPQGAQIVDFTKQCLKDFGLLALSAVRRSKTPQGAPKTAPRQPKTPPR
eukprot:7800397-Pyramimonas_sp.AAC.1